VQTKAVRDGDEYVINGSKIWTTLGNYADHMILLARTDPTAERKYDGLSFFLSPMKVAGVDAVPIRKVTGEYGFNQVFFTDTRIPADTLMVGEGKGWGVAMKTLEYERGVTAGQATGHWMVAIEIDDLINDLRGFERDGAPVFDDPAVRDEAVGLIMEAKALSLSARRMGVPALTSDFPMGLPLSSKYRGTEWSRRMKLFGAAMQGAQGALYVEDPNAHRGGFWQRAYFSNFGATIGGGTSQVQANIIAEHVLGLPK
ncbi:MAG: acyl-CoA dehydrogenase, partial [Halieaceae bacterium]|nr:acyl-CoA dehydrogenase [Halieaceae bacterium]